MNKSINSMKHEWKFIFRNSLKSTKAIKDFFNTDIDQTPEYFTSIPMNIAERIKYEGMDSPLAKQFIPSLDENSKSGYKDPIGDLKNSKGHGIIHRYKSRILFTPTTICPIQCRYCFRKNELNENDPIFKKSLFELKKYIEENEEVEEVILTGGDPLMLDTKKLKEITEVLHSVKIKYLRFHTRTPVIIPERIDAEFIDFLKSIEEKFVRVTIAIHSNHKSEITDEVRQSLLKLKNLRIHKIVQTVLLKGVNDSADSLTLLFKKLISCDFTPYYLHHPDQARGAMHFYLPIKDGKSIYKELRQNLPGWAIPHYILDSSSGNGKTLVLEN